MDVRLHRTKSNTPDSDRGGVLVEFALISSLLVGLLLGTITTGLSFNRNIALTNSARESARYAATLPVDGDLSAWLNTAADVAIESASGDLIASTPGQRICIAYVYPDGTDLNDRTTSIVESAGSRTISNASCFTDARPDSERRIQVRVERDSTIQLGVTSTTSNLRADSIMRFERA